MLNNSFNCTAKIICAIMHVLNGKIVYICIDKILLDCTTSESVLCVEFVFSIVYMKKECRQMEGERKYLSAATTLSIAS